MPQMTIREKLDERKTLFTEAEGLRKKALDENRDMNDAENERFNTCLDRVSELTGEIDDHNKALERDARLEETRKLLERGASEPPRRQDPDSGNDGNRTKEGPFELRLRSGEPSRDVRGVRGMDVVRVTAESPYFRRCLEEYEAAFRSYLQRGDQAPEIRSLSQGDDTEGGYLVPMQFVARLIQAVDDMNFVRARATVIPQMVSKSLGVPSLDADPADAVWTSEIATGDEDSTMAFGKRELSPNPLAKRIKVSKKLMRSGALSVEDIVLERLSYILSKVEENAFLTGTGADQPLGVFTASSDGISTGRDVSTGNTTTAFTYTGLANAKYTLKSQYWPSARWMFHRDAVKMLATLLDGNDLPLWQPSIQMGQPDMLLGRPMDVSEYAPNTFTTGLYVGLFCDWSYYWIADALDMEIQRLVELYAETNQVGFIARKETDGMPVLEEAFVRVTLA